MDEPSDLQPADDPKSFQNLMRRLQEGSEDAAWEVFDRYSGYIFRAVRRNLNLKLRSKFDSFDFVQRVWLSFYRVRERAGSFETPQQLAKFLAGMGRNKVNMEVRHRMSTEQYDVTREVPFTDALGEEGRLVTAPQPDPADLAIARERMEQLLEGQPAHYRRIIELKSEGFTCAEIGKILDLDEHTVHRFLKKLLLVTDV